MAIERILIVDDEPLMRSFLEEALRRKKIDVHIASEGKKALALLRENVYDMVITDMKMPEITGIDILRYVKDNHPATITVVITAFGSIENAVEAMRLGAFNYLIKPFSPDTIEAIIEKAQEHLALVEENHYLRQQINGNGHFPTNIIAESPAMKKILLDVERVAKSNANIFISGESGTGKEIVAGLIHNFSLRSHRPFIKVNCAAIPETLVESEFFGHEKGSFTGAHAKRLGRFELANTGTILLDEITEIPLTVQSKLLRAIQEHEFERVGSSKVVKVDVRIVSTSNRNIQEAIAQKRLREDLYFRLNVVPIEIPPLRERTEDIIPLSDFFAEKFSLENHKKPKKLSDAAYQKLLHYSFPGNVRELANIVERAVVMTPGDFITPEYLFLEAATNGDDENFDDNSITTLVGMTLQELEKRLIIETFSQYKEQKKAAEVLGISLRTLRSRLHDYKIEN